MASAGSRSGRPSASIAQPSGSSRPSSQARRSLPMATVLVAMSRQKGGLRRAGAAKAMGLVPNIGSRPRVGTTEAFQTLLVARPMKPASAAIRA